jgi:hypothetical protein
MIDPATYAAVFIGVSAITGMVAYVTHRPKNTSGTSEPFTDKQNDAVDAYMRENPAASLLVYDDRVRPVYDLDDRFLRKISKIEIDGKMHNVRVVVRSSGTLLECTAHGSNPLSFNQDGLRQLKKDHNIVLYCVTEIDFSNEAE